MLTADSLFDLTQFAHASLFSADTPVWFGLKNLKAYMDDYTYPAYPTPLLLDSIPLREPVVLHNQQFIAASGLRIDYGDTTKGKLCIYQDETLLEGASLIMAGAILLGDRIVIGNGVLIEGGATIKSPAIVDDFSEIRQGAYMRGYCLIGKRCVVGHATEVKHSIFLDDAKAGHFAYLGDSILGNNVNLGAGTKFANLRFIPGTVRIMHQLELIDTTMRKFGAILGDGAQTGCNSVTNPGTIIGKGGILMPNATAPPGTHLDRKKVN